MLTPGSFIAKTAALAILAIILLAANLFAVQPLYEAYRKNYADITTSRELLRRYQALAAEKPGLVQRLTSLQSEVDSSAAYLEGASHALAAADLQDLVADVIDKAGGEVGSLRSHPAADVEDHPELRRTGLQLRFAADIESFAEILHDLETMEPRLAIDRLDVMDANTRRSRGHEKTAPVLDVRLDVYGYARLQE